MHLNAFKYNYIGGGDAGDTFARRVYSLRAYERRRGKRINEQVAVTRGSEDRAADSLRNRRTLST